MSRAARSIIIFGIYVVVTGLGLLLLPNTLLSVAGLPTTSEVWIRMLGLLVAIVGCYYLYLGRLNVVPFFRVTVPGRLALALGLLTLVLLDQGDPQVLLFAVLDSAGAIWTWFALRKETAATYQTV